MSTVVERLRSIVGPGSVLDAAGDLDPYRRDSVYHASGVIQCVVRPSDTRQVSDVLRACLAEGACVVPRGGGTGLSGGSLPRPEDCAVILSLERMRRVRSVDPVGDVLVVEAGVTLHEAREAARAASRTIGLDHGGSSASQIGGNLATNAGGKNVLRYGMARDQVLGLELVLADGTILGPPQVLRKSNAGYDLRHLVVGSEGTLGVITAAALKMRPAPVACATALLASDSPNAILDLLVLARRLLGESISAFELMSATALDFHFARAGRSNAFFTTKPAWAVLLEAESASEFFDLEAAFSAVVEQALEADTVRDGVIATSEAQRAAMWAMREGIPLALHASIRPIVSTDTAVPIAAVASFVEAVEQRSLALVPEGVPLFFGHVGDGNIHFNFLPPPQMDSEAFRRRMPKLLCMVEDAALSFGGTISAEHGIGQSKREALLRMKSADEIRLMGAIRTAFDPARILNPGKIIAC